MNMANMAMGVDIGGTHITAALIDLQKKTIIPSSVKRANVNTGSTADEIIHSWLDCINESKQNSGTESICFAMPGPFDYEAGISLMRGQDKYESLYGLNIKEQLAGQLKLPIESIFMDNDAACFLQGEVFNGIATAHDKNTVIGITLGTGLGSAVYKNGKSCNADMWCWPFKEGIAEDYLSTRWFVKRWNQLTTETIKGVKELTTRKDERVKDLFNEFAEHLSSFLLNFITKELPAAVVIGGNISKAFDWFAPQLMTNISSQHPGTKIKQAILGEEAQLLGAVSSWLQKKKTDLTLS